jgi:DNA-binding LacI/PurR family transcriptional regulator
MAVTISDVAKEANVSTATVSRVLNKKHNNISIGEVTKAKVQEAAERLKYRPSALARALAGGRTRTIGVLFDNLSTLFVAEVIESIESYARQRDYHIILVFSRNDVREEKKCMETFLEKRVDGVIFGPSQLNMENVKYFEEELRKENMPLVFMNSYLGEADHRNFVVIDNKLGALKAVNYLIKLGHRRIGHITGPNSFCASQERLSGYKQALEDSCIGYDDRLIKHMPDVRMESGYQGMKEFLEMQEPPTAVFAASDMNAVGAMKAVREAGLKIPQDISLVGFDDVELTSYLDVPLTTVSQCQDRVGGLAAKIIIDKIEKNTEDKLQQNVLDPKLIIRDSCAPYTS